MSACLLVNSTIILSLMVVKSLKHVFILFQKMYYLFLYSYRSVSVLFFCVRTDLLYWYHFPVFVPILCIGTVFLYSNIYCAYNFTCYYLPPDSCMLSPDTCLISLITCHLIHYHLSCDYHILRILPAILYYIYSDLYF